MALIDKNTLKDWFSRGKKPLASQFANWIDSYWHKAEKIPMSGVEDLPATLNTKAEKLSLTAETNARVEGDTNLQNQIDGLQKTDEKAQPNGYAPLDADNKVPAEHLPDIVNSVNGETGDVVLTATDVGAATPAQLATAKTEAIAEGKTYTDGKVTLYYTKTDSDGKFQPKGDYALAIHNHKIGDTTGLQAALDSKATPAQLATAKTEAITESKTYTDSTVNNIQVGGRNLLPNSDFNVLNTAYYQLNAGATYSLSLDNKMLKIVGVDQGNGDTNNRVIIRQLLFNENADYILSFDAYALMDTTVSARAAYGSTQPGGTALVGTTKTRYSLKLRGIFQNDTYNVFFLWFDKITTVWLDNMQLEKGNKATNWSPAPEDIVAELASHVSNKGNPHAVTAAQTGAATPAQLATAKTEAIAEGKTYTDGKLTLYYTKTDSDGKYQPKGNYALAVHKHAIADVTGLQLALDAKAEKIHPHIISDTTGLQAALDRLLPFAQVDDVNKTAILTNQAVYGGKIGGMVGTMKLTLPSGFSNAMSVFEIDIYNYVENSNSKIIVSGYNYSGDNTWRNTGVTKIGYCPWTVRVAYDGSKCSILIGNITTIWQYPQILLSKVIAGFSGYASMVGKYDISLITDETGIIRIVIPPVIEYASVVELTSHVSNKANPHAVTAAQTGAATPAQVATAKTEAITESKTYTDGKFTLYYTKTDSDGKYQPKGSYALAVHKHVIADITGLQLALDAKALATDLTAHIGNKANPHGVTAAQTGALPITGGVVTGNIAAPSVHIKGPVSVGVDFNSTNPFLMFSGHLDAQRIKFIYTDRDDYRAPAGIKMIGEQGNEWLEVPRLIKTGSSDAYILLGGGGHKPLSDIESKYLPLTGGALTGTLILNIKNLAVASYTEGIRVNRYSSGWAGLMLGSAPDSVSGHDGLGWYIARNPDGVLMLNPTGSAINQGLDLYKNDDIRWRGLSLYNWRGIVGFGGNMNEITTDEFLALLVSKNAFTGNTTFRGTWSYISNQVINDAGGYKIHLAGATIQVIGSGITACTIIIHTPTTTGNNSGSAISSTFIYVNNGPTYLPGWRRLANTTDIEGKYLPLTGGTLSGGLIVNSSIAASASLHAGYNNAAQALLYLNGKTALRGIDVWLRLNDLNEFTAGIYCGTSVLRTDGELQVGASGSVFSAKSGVVTSNVPIFINAPAASNWAYQAFRIAGVTKWHIGVNPAAHANVPLNSLEFQPLGSATNGSWIDPLGNWGINRRLQITNQGYVAPFSTNSRSAGMYGMYDSTKIGHIWSMGTGYKIPDDGSNFGNLYGMAYKHTNNTTGGNMANGHQAVWCENGVPKVALGQHVWTKGGYLKEGSSDNYVLLGGGGHKPVSDFATATEANWVPTFVDDKGVAVAGITYTARTASYYRIGKIGYVDCSLRFSFIWDKKINLDTLIAISGLPFNFRSVPATPLALYRKFIGSNDSLINFAVCSNYDGYFPDFPRSSTNVFYLGMVNSGVGNNYFATELGWFAREEDENGSVVEPNNKVYEGAIFFRATIKII